MNVVESPRSLKRDHEEFIDDSSSPTPHMSQPLAQESKLLNEPQNHCANSPELNALQPANVNRANSPAPSSAGSLTDAGTTTPSGGNGSPASAFALMNGIASAPPAKKPKLSFQEKQTQDAIRQAKRMEKAEEKARKDAEKAQREVEKLRKDAEKEAERVKREAEREQKRLAKEAENAEKEKARKLREEEKQKKEEEKQKLEEEKRKKERSQPKLNAFFGTPKTKSKEASPAPSLPADATLTPSKSIHKPSETSEYEKMFPPFFQKDQVTVAPLNHYETERWGSDDVEGEIDAHLGGQKQVIEKVVFDASNLFNCPDLCLNLRGRTITPVRDIMTRAYGQEQRPIDLTTDSQNTQIKHTRKLLRRVPYKTIAFSQDVRPPYCGTHTRHCLAKLKKLARQPTKPQLEDLQYDYDSEAEWVEDGEEEDAEDLLSEAGDDEDADDLDQDLDGLIDDEDDQLANRKRELPADQQPKSTGLCWENHKRVGPNLRLYGYHMEIMHENQSLKTPIDPFSTSYWETAAPATAQGLMEPPRIPLGLMKGTSPNVNGPNPMKLFGATDMLKASGPALAPPKNGFISSPEDLKIFRQEVEGNNLTKVGLIEVVHTKMSKATKAQVKSSIEHWAHQVGAKRADKRWRLNDLCPT